MSQQTVNKWPRRFREEGLSGLADRSSRALTSPRCTSEHTAAWIVKARFDHFAGPVALSGLLGLPASTIGAVLRRAEVPRLSETDRVTGEVIKGRKHGDVRSEHALPGLLHVDVKKLGKIPPGGRWRAHGRSEQVRGRGLGWDFVHVAIDAPQPRCLQRRVAR